MKFNPKGKLDRSQVKDMRDPFKEAQRFVWDHGLGQYVAADVARRNDAVRRRLGRKRNG